MKKILITGANGFIGKNLKESLDKNYTVKAPTHQELDLSDTSKTQYYLEEQAFDVIIHCANTNNTRPGGGVTDYQILDQNLRMYWNLCRCEHLYHKMYYFGSGAEYDMQHYIPDMREDYFGTYIPQDAYGFSKYIMNQNARKSEKIFNLRLFGVYGKYEEWNRRFISNNICRVLKGLNISINQDMSFDYLYIEDLCNMMPWFIENTPQHHDYNVCTGVSVHLSELAVMLRSKFDCSVSIQVKAEGEKLPYTGNNERLLNEIGDWEFTNISIAMDILLEYYRQLYQTDVIFREKLNRFSFLQ